ncbi:MAG TPA: thioesterase family protein [Acidobacteriota bacterium]
MSRIKIELPESFSFSTEIPIRITDLNYGGHVGNDTVLTIIHEARMQMLSKLGYTSELNVDGVGMIMVDAGIEFKGELFYGDNVLASVAVDHITKIGFDLYYKLEKISAGEKSPVVLAKTGMLCFDYEKRKIVPIPEEFKQKLIK